MLKRLSILAFLLLSSFSFVIAQKQAKGKCLQGDCLNGYGLYVFENGEKYKGNWLNGLFHGKGEYYYASGNFYQGTFFEGLRHGIGNFKWSDGTSYYGDYKNDVREGEGMVYDDKGTIMQNGFFKDGKFVSGSTPFSIQLTIPEIVPGANPPTISFITPSMQEETTERAYKFKACISSELPLTEIKVYVNNMVQVATRGFVVEDEGDCPNAVERVIHLNPGDNKIVVVAHNTKGQARLESHTIHLTIAEGAQVSQQPNGERRRALIIGNASYLTSPLKNPINDAVAMTNTLSAMDFDVTLITDASSGDMKRAIKEFGKELAVSKAVGLFYYAGHGVQLNGVNYLLPTNAEIEKEIDVEVEGIDLARVFVEFEYAKNPMNLIILDACRDNPYAGSRSSGSLARSGFTDIKQAPANTFIAFSTGTGQVAIDGSGDNGLYTEELLKTLNEPGLRVEEIFKKVRASVRNISKNTQVPWESSSLEKEFFFIPKQ